MKTELLYLVCAAALTGLLYAGPKRSGAESSIAEVPFR